MGRKSIENCPTYLNYGAASYGNAVGLAIMKAVRRRDYGLRVRVEKWNDSAVAERCKHRGMSWKIRGVLAMALHAAKEKRSIDQGTKIEPKKHTRL